jgi:hypothetical protein
LVPWLLWARSELPCGSSHWQAVWMLIIYSNSWEIRKPSINRPWDILRSGITPHIWRTGWKAIDCLGSWFLEWPVLLGERGRTSFCPKPRVTLPALFCDGFSRGVIQNRVSRTICLGWLRTKILMISASLVARITGMSYRCQATLWVLHILSPSLSSHCLEVKLFRINGCSHGLTGGHTGKLGRGSLC